MGGTSGKVFIDTSISRVRGNLGSSSRNVSRNSLTTEISFNRKLSLSKFKMYARYPMHPFLGNFLVVTTDIRLIWLGILSPLKTILLPSGIWNVTVLV